MSKKPHKNDNDKIPKELTEGLIGWGEFMPQFTAEGFMRIREEAKAREDAAKRKDKDS